jgi:hypothetical protein
MSKDTGVIITLNPGHSGWISITYNDQNDHGAIYMMANPVDAQGSLRTDNYNKRRELESVGYHSSQNDGQRSYWINCTNIGPLGTRVSMQYGGV